MANQGRIQEAQVENDVELVGEEGEEDEVDKLESEVNEMAQKILDYRTTLPDQLKSTLSSVLAAQRPILPTHFDSGSESAAEPSNDTTPDVVRPNGSGNGSLLGGNDQETEKIRILKQKISSNASSMPSVLKRMNDSMTRIEELNSCDGIIIHPAFKRKRTSRL